MRTVALIAAAAAAFTLSACNKPAEDTTDASTEAAEASGAAVDTMATADGSVAGGASAGNDSGSASGSGYGSGSGSGSSSRANSGGQAMAPSGSATVNDGAMAPNARPAAAGDNQTDTARRLNPPQNNGQ